METYLTFTHRRHLLSQRLGRVNEFPWCHHWIENDEAINSGPSLWSSHLPHICLLYPRTSSTLFLIIPHH